MENETPVRFRGKELLYDCIQATIVDISVVDFRHKKVSDVPQWNRFTIAFNIQFSDNRQLFIESDEYPLDPPSIETIGLLNDLVIRHWDNGPMYGWRSIVSTLPQFDMTIVSCGAIICPEAGDFKREDQCIMALFFNFVSDYSFAFLTSDYPAWTDLVYDQCEIEKLRCEYADYYREIC